MFSLPKRGLAVMKTIRYITLCVCAVATLLEPLAYAQPPRIQTVDISLIPIYTRFQPNRVTQMHKPI